MGRYFLALAVVFGIGPLAGGALWSWIFTTLHAWWPKIPAMPYGVGLELALKFSVAGVVTAVIALVGYAVLQD